MQTFTITAGPIPSPSFFYFLVSTLFTAGVVGLFCPALTKWPLKKQRDVTAPYGITGTYIHILIYIYLGL